MSTPAIAPTSVNIEKTKDCVFVTTHFSMGIGRMKQVRNLKVETNADPNQLRHQKKLMDCPELEEIRSQDGYMKRHIDSVSCSFDESTRFVEKSVLNKLYRSMVAYRTIRRPKLVADFMAVYRKMEADNFQPIREALGDTFNRADYPDADTVEKGFDFEFFVRAVGNIQLVGLSNEIVEMEAAKEVEKRRVAVAEWTGTMRVALHGVVTELFNALKTDPVTGKRKKLYDTHVDSLVEFCKSFPSRNLGDDQECMKVRNQILDLMKGVSVDSLRESENLKDVIASKLEAVKSDLGTMVIAVGRKFR